MTDFNDELFDDLLVAPLPVTPPDQLKEKVLEKIATEQQPTALAAKRPKAITMAGWLLAAASVSVLAIGGGIYFSQLGPQEESAASAKLQEDTAIGEAAPGQPAVPESGDYNEQMPTILQDSASVVSAADAVTTDLKAEGMLLSVVSSESMKESVVILGQPPTSDTQLQLWAIDSEGQHVFVGVLEKELWIPLPYASTGLVITSADSTWDGVSPEPDYPSGTVVLEHRF